MINKYIFTYESHQYDAFSIHTNRGIINCRTNKQEPCVFNPTYTTENPNLITTVEEYMVVSTSIQIDRTKLASKINNNVGLPTVKNFDHMVSTNMISNCPISVAYISNSGKIYGPYMAILKGKSTKSKPMPVIKYDIHITSELYKKTQTLSYALTSYI